MAWWKKALIGVAVLSLWIGGLIIFGAENYQSQYFWASVATIAIGFAVQPFWRLRSKRWYWPTIAVLVAAHVASMYIWRDFTAQEELPTKGIVQAMGVIDIMACWSIMVIVAYLSGGKWPWRE